MYVIEWVAPPGPLEPPVSVMFVVPGAVSVYEAVAELAPPVLLFWLAELGAVIDIAVFDHPGVGGVPTYEAPTVTVAPTATHGSKPPAVPLLNVVEIDG